MTREFITERIIKLCEEINKNCNTTSTEELLLTELEKLCLLSVQMRSNNRYIQMGTVKKVAVLH